MTIFNQASRKICGAVKSGVREFTETGFKIVTGVLTGINRSQIDVFSIKVAQIIQHQVKDFAPTIAIIYLLHLHQIN